MNLIEEYFELAKICATTDYADKKSVRKHNKSVDRMYEIAEAIGHEKTHETIDAFKALLDIRQNGTHIWAAVHMIEKIPIDKETERKAINLIEEMAKGDTAEAMGFRFWLDEYYKSKA